MCTPANTPATPPNFPDALTMFSRLKASESFNSGSPMTASMATSPPPPQVGGWGVSPNVPNVPQPPLGLWTHGQPPTQPCPAWPTGVNPNAGTEQKASVAMEAERWRATQDWKAPVHPGEGGRVSVEWMQRKCGGRGGGDSLIILLFPKLIRCGERDGWGRRRRLRKPRKT